MERNKSDNLLLISQLKEWCISLGLPAHRMYENENQSHVVWFVAHAEDSLGNGFYLHYYDVDEDRAYTEQKRLASLGLDVYLFSTDGVSDAKVGILQKMFELESVALVYTVLHEIIHEILADKFFQSVELQSGYRERDIIGQIDEGLAVFLGFTLSKMFIGDYLPPHVQLLDNYIQVTREFYQAIKELIQARLSNKDENLIRSRVNEFNLQRNQLEFGDRQTVDAIDDFNGAYIGLMKRYCWILDEIQNYFEVNSISPTDFLAEPSKYRGHLFSLTTQANRYRR